ncbi:MAG: Hsp20/alpha crystallin family protein, partial [Bacteriovorax sp.]|nr:Hsp20/alpha crystallin family protein [Bacteriovorax sp.]
KFIHILFAIVVVLIASRCQKEVEIDKVKEFYDKKVDATKVNGEDRYVNTLARNDQLLVGASKDYEEKLLSYNQNLLKTQKEITKEEMALKSDQAQKMESFRDQYQNNIKDQFQTAHNNEVSIQDQTQNNLKTIVEGSRNEQNHAQNLAKTKIDHLSQDFNQKGIAAERDFRATLGNDQSIHEAELKLQRSDLKKIMDKNNEQNKRVEQEKMKTQTAELNYLDNHQKDVILQKQNDFKVRYANMVKEHDSILHELKSHFEADMKKAAIDSSSKKRIIASKGNDQFYKVELLNPTLNENEKEFYVSLAVPEHEKENVHLSVSGRGVKLNLTRKFSDTVEDADGSSNKSTRNELFSKDFPSKDILNSKQVVQKYENGILTFKIQKL